MAVDSNRSEALKRIAGQIRERDSMRASLSAAKRRQLTMLPRIVPEAPGYEFAWVYEPAEHVSGDFYDLVDLGRGRIGVLMGDVSGHGMEAGMIMGMAKKALQIYARAEVEAGPAEVLYQANEDLGQDLDSETFLTVVYGVLDTAAGKLDFIRAGHTHPILLGPEPGKWQVMKSGGMMIGMTGGPIFKRSLEPNEIALEPGQTFFIYTDGIIEAHERGGAIYGVDRLLEYLEAEAPSGKPLQGVLDGLIDALDDWTGGAEAEDDITVLAIRRNA